VIPFRNPGRSTGFWYLVLILLGPLRLLYIPKTLFVSNDATGTISNILSHETLFRFGMVSDLICAVLLVVVTLAFYRLFQDVSRYLGAWVVILGGVMPAILAFAGVGTDNSTLYIAHGPSFLSVFDKPQRDALAMLMLHARDRETTAAELLWGLWLIPLALLVWRSRLLPRFIAVWLFLNAAAYVAVSLTGLLLPDLEGSVFSLTTPARLGELVLTLWLLVRGADPARARPAAA
jgi:hypothetical protein